MKNQMINSYESCVVQDEELLSSHRGCGVFAFLERRLHHVKYNPTTSKQVLTGGTF